PSPRHHQVLAVEAGTAGQRDALAVDEEARLAQALAELGVGAQGEGRAVDVELGIAAGVAAVADGEVQQLVPARLERIGHRLEELPALREGQLAQGRPPRVPGKLERGGEVEARASRL